MGDDKKSPPAGNGSIGDSEDSALVEAKLDLLRKLFNKRDDDQLRIVGVGAGAWGSVFIAQLQVLQLFLFIIIGISQHEHMLFPCTSFLRS
jgi:hypothetical protein